MFLFNIKNDRVMIKSLLLICCSSKQLRIVKEGIQTMNHLLQKQLLYTSVTFNLILILALKDVKCKKKNTKFREEIRNGKFRALLYHITPSTLYDDMASADQHSSTNSGSPPDTSVNYTYSMYFYCSN